MWVLEDYTKATSGPTGTRVGYLRISKDGQRIADVFPYVDKNPASVVAAANWLVNQANKAAE